MFWLKYHTWNNGKHKWHPTGSCSRFSPFFPPSPQFTTSIRTSTTFSPQPPHKISFSDPQWATPNLCLGPLTLQRRASDGQIFQQAFFHPTPEKKLERSSAFLLEHCSGPNCPFSEDFEPSTFHVKNWNFAHQLDGHTTKHHCTWKLVLMALETLFKISSWLLPGSCPWLVLFQTLTIKPNDSKWRPTTPWQCFNNKKKHQMRNKCFDWNVEHETMEEALSPNWLLTSLLTFSTPQFTTSQLILTTCPTQQHNKLSFWDPQ